MGQCIDAEVRWCLKAIQSFLNDYVMISSSCLLSCFQTVKQIEKCLCKSLSVNMLLATVSCHIVKKYFYKSFLSKSFTGCHFKLQYTKKCPTLLGLQYLMIFLRNLKVESKTVKCKLVSIQVQVLLYQKNVKGYFNKELFRICWANAGKVLRTLQNKVHLTNINIYIYIYIYIVCILSCCNINKTGRSFIFY